MKLLLLQPPIQDFYDTDIRLQPLGLAYLKSAARKFLPEVEVVVKDYHQGWGRRTVALPRELAYLRDFYPCPDESPFSSFHQYYHFGADFEDLAEDVAREKPDLVGISSLFSPYYREALRAAEVVKKRLGVPVLAGGSHVSAMPLEMLSHPAVDFVIRGEGERPLVEFLKSWSNGRHFETVQGLGFKKDGELVLNPIGENYPLEEIPAPDLSDLTPSHYLFEGRPLSFLITSRSCPHRCTFCSVHTTFGLRYRRRAVESVLEEMRLRYEEGIRVFDFEDDNLTFYQDEMKELCRRIPEAFPAGDVRLLAMNGISYLSLTPELLGMMKRAGFTHLNIALVSSDITVRETTKRPHTIPKYLEAVSEAARLGFQVVSYQILGLPGESLESMIQTLCFAARLPVLLGASPFYLTPASPIAKNFPAPNEEDVFKSRLTAMAIERPDFRREDLYTLFITTRILNFLKGLRVEKAECDLEDALQAAREGDARSKAGARLLERLLEEQRLYAWTGKGLRLLERFDGNLFRRIWSEVGWVATQSGKRIKTGQPCAV